MAVLLFCVATFIYQPNIYFVDYVATVPECIDEKKYRRKF